MRPFEGEQLAGNGPDVFLVGRIDAVAPLPGLQIQIIPTGEPASGKEVVLDKMKRSLDACGTIRMPEFMGSELETETFAEGFHLRHGSHLASGAAQHHHVRVVDHDPTASAVEKTQGIG